MSDWKNNQYDHGPKYDPLAGVEGIKWILIVFGLIAGIAGLVALSLWWFASNL